MPFVKERWTRAVCVSLALSLAACGGEEGDGGGGAAAGGSGPGTGDQPLQCSGDGYVAFDAANYQNQILRVGAYVEMNEKMKAAASADPFDPDANRAAFEQAKKLYEETASFRDKVKGRVDDHLPDKPNVGAELDARIIEWLDKGAQAQDGLAATIARQWVDKSLAEFFFLSVHHEMVQGATKNWDEAFGYFGAPEDNDEGGRKGLAAIATKRDGTNGTTLELDIYNGLIDGSCELARALAEAGTDKIDYTTVPALKGIVEDTDRAMQEVLAYSAGHEAFEMVELQQELAADPGDPEVQAEMWVKLAELDPYFRPLERLMIARGGDSKTRAEEIRALLDAAWQGWEARDGAWMPGFDAAGIVDRLEAEYGIDVKG